MKNQIINRALINTLIFLQKLLKLAKLRGPNSLDLDRWGGTRG